MKIFNKISDWATNNSVNYSKENSVYDNVTSEIDKLNENINFVINSELLYDYFSEEEQVINFLNCKIDLEMKKNLLKKSKSDNYNKIFAEIKKIEEEYRMLLKKIKNLILKDDRITDIQKSAFEINSIIYRNVLLEALKPFFETDIIYKKWTIEELENLRNTIAKRRTVILPYLIEIDYNKRK